MKLKELLDLAQSELGSKRESQYLLCAFLRTDLAYLLSHLEEELEGSPAEFFRWLKERKRGVPLAYLARRKDFYGQCFYIDQRTLIPRPETELLLEEALLLAAAKEKKGSDPFFCEETPLLLKIADLGTGSGVLAVSLALELPHSSIYALDVSSSALEVARINAQLYGVSDRIAFLKGELLSPLPEPVDMVVANLPYLPSSLIKETLELSFEPRLALEGGKEGWETIIRFLKSLKAEPSELKSQGTVLLEIGENQAFLKEEAQKLFPYASVELKADLQGLPRLLIIKKG